MMFAIASWPRPSRLIFPTRLKDEAGVKEYDDSWSLPELLERMPAAGEPITDGKPYMREEAPGEYVIQGVGYLPMVDRIWATFRTAGFPTEGQFEYGAWLDAWLDKAGADRLSVGHVATMTREDCYNLLRFIERAERFGDGAWQAAHQDGLFHAIARRLIELAGGDKRHRNANNALQT